MTHRRTNADYTNFPRIFSNTYWAGFKVPQGNEMPITIANRNRFVADYNITRNENNPPRALKLHNPRYINIVRLGTEFFDHGEFYRNNLGGYVLIISPYAEDHVERDRKLTELGWQKIYPLYHSSATTYVKIVPCPLPRTNKQKLQLLKELFRVLENEDMNPDMLKYHLRQI